MKKLVSLMAVFSILLTLSACSGSKDKTYGLNDTAKFEAFTVKANKLTKSDGDEIYKPKSGNIFVLVNFTVKNTTDEESIVSTILMFTPYADGEQCDASLAALEFSGNGLDETLQAREETSGYYCLEVPKDSKVLEIEVNLKTKNDANIKFKFDL